MIPGVSTTPCTRCGRTLPPDVVRELERGTRCPFCAATLSAPTAKSSVLATTIIGHARALEGAPASAAPAPPEAAAWLNSLLKTIPAPATAEPAVEPPPPPAPPVVEPISPPTPPVIAEAPPPPPPAVALEPPPPPAVAVSAERATEPDMAAVSEPPPVRPARLTPAAPVLPVTELETDAIVLPPVAKTRRVLIAVGAVVLGGVMAFVLRGSSHEAPPAPVAAEPAPPAVAPPPVPAPKATESVEIGLDPATPKKAPAAEAEAPATERPAPRRERERAADTDEAPAAGELAKARAQAVAYEKEGKVAEALAAYQQALALAKRTRDRQQIARRMYDLTHPGE
jgi:hypothetical protein